MQKSAQECEKTEVRGWKFEVRTSTGGALSSKMGRVGVYPRGDEKSAEVIERKKVMRCPSRK